MTDRRINVLLSQMAPPRSLLDVYGLARNPFSVRVAEKDEAASSPEAYYSSSRRSLPTGQESYLWFGRRGSGKTTLRLQLEALQQDEAFVVSLTDPAKLNNHLEAFSRSTGCSPAGGGGGGGGNDDDDASSSNRWGRHFEKHWRTEDFVDMFVVAAVAELQARVLRDLKQEAQTGGQAASATIRGLRSDRTTAVRFVVFCALFGQSGSDGSGSTADEFGAMAARLLRPHGAGGGAASIVARPIAAAAAVVATAAAAAGAAGAAGAGAGAGAEVEAKGAARGGARGLGAAAAAAAAAVRPGAASAASSISKTLRAAGRGVQRGAAATPPRVTGAALAVGAVAVAAGAAGRALGRYRRAQRVRDLLGETRILLLTKAREQVMQRAVSAACVPALSEESLAEVRLRYLGASAPQRLKFLVDMIEAATSTTAATKKKRKTATKDNAGGEEKETRTRTVGEAPESSSSRSSKPPLFLGDSFDEAKKLDAVRYPGTMKKFVSEACRNDLLSAGCFQLFFPGSRHELGVASLDKEKQFEARFDRHHVVELEWSLEELLALAARKWAQAQTDATKRLQSKQGAAAAGASNEDSDATTTTATTTATTTPAAGGLGFLLGGVGESAITKWLGQLSTPRDMLICFDKLLQIVEGKRPPPFQATADDIEAAVGAALRERAP